ncbi:hypothetical protein BREVNS_1941 [Brevinematales bacterium NS]|nr:hypothetical protein BREVNS_1941 [Brevinematales bacterium NS]
MIVYPIRKIFAKREENHRDDFVGWVIEEKMVLKETKTIGYFLVSAKRKKREKETGIWPLGYHHISARTSLNLPFS